MKPEDVLDRYLDAAEESSKAVRWALVAMIIGSIVIFAAIWNSRPGNWLQYEVSTLALMRRDNVLRLQFQEAQAKAFPPRINSREAVLQEVALSEARTSIADLDALIKKLQAAGFDAHYVQLPFFGVSFHLNDAGLIGCFALVVLSTLVAYSFRRQLTILSLLFEEGRSQECLVRCYHIAGMAQVFTTVPTTAAPYFGFARHLPKAILLCPVVAGGFVVWVDWMTRTSVAFDVFLGRMMLSVDLVYVVCVLTVGTFVLAHRLDMLWKAVAIELGILVPGDTTDSTQVAQPPASLAPAANVPLISVTTTSPATIATNTPIEAGPQIAESTPSAGVGPGSDQPA